MALKRWAISEFDYTALTSWTASGSGTDEYYYSGAAINEPAYVTVDGSVATEGALGSLAAGQFGWGDNDTIGHDTVYARLAAGTSPGSTDVYYFITDTQTLLTAATDEETILLHMMINNYSSDDASVTVEHTDGSDTLFQYDLDLLSTDSPFSLDAKIVLEPSDTIQVTSDVPEVCVIASGDAS